MSTILKSKLKPNLTILFFLLSLFNFAQNIWVPYDFEVVSSDCIGRNEEIYISEVYDSNGYSYGIVELYNPTDNPVTLNDVYKFRKYGDIGAATYLEYDLDGTIQPLSTLLLRFGAGGSVCNNITAINVDTSQGYNANDEFELVKNDIVIDNVHAPNFIGYSIRRNATAIAPLANYNAADWTITQNAPNSTTGCTTLGTHTENLTPLQITNLEQFLGTIGTVTFEECKLLARLRVTFTGGIGNFQYRITYSNGVTTPWGSVNANPFIFPNFYIEGETYIEIRDNHSGCIVKIKFTLYNIRTSPILQT